MTQRNPILRSGASRDCARITGYSETIHLAVKMCSFSADRRLGVDPDEFVSKEILWCASGAIKTALRFKWIAKLCGSLLVQLDAALDSANGSTESQSQLA
jgi:hypothetical protein